MALYALASAKGSPGVTVTASALAAVWPTEPVLADLDPAGGDIAWRYRDAEGRPLDPQHGLLSLGAAVRRGAEGTDVTEHLQEVSGGLRVLAGLATPSQAVGLGAAWSQLGRVFAMPGTDVFADCGRVGPGSPNLPVLAAADAVLLVTRPTVEQIAHLRDLVRLLEDQLRTAQLGGTPLGIAVLTSYRDAQSARDLRQLLDAEGLQARVLGVVAEDHKAAEVLCGHRASSVSRSLLLRSAADLADGLVALGEHRAEVVG